MKSIMFFILILILFSCNQNQRDGSNENSLDTVTLSEDIYTSKKFKYSIQIPKGWEIKDETYTINIDLKLIDGNGNSIIIKVEPLSEKVDESAYEIFSIYSNREIEQMLGANTPNPKIVKRGKIKIDNVEWVYFHFTSKESNENTTLLHKQYSAFYNMKLYSITMTCFTNQENANLTAFDLITKSFKFSSLK